MRRRLIGSFPDLAFGTIAATAVVLSFYTRDEALVFASAQQCIAGEIDPQVCGAAAEDAKQAHLATAPRFSNMAACEMDYGLYKCVEQGGMTVPNNLDGQSVFIPILAGFVLSSGIKDLNDYFTFRRKEEEEEGAYNGATTIYYNRKVEMVTPVVEKPGAGRLTQAPGPTSMKPFNAKTHAASRGGFGGRFFSGG
ncbi:DUF1190 domain-containing protein [Rhizobium sp. FY34]|uniref:DUF1190 domain-containing protein n=1 Tax=Rhizobium sp. FY34 TaxID=2562309 RepID=UPI0010C0F96F|nr:DUF1190 domain-containing protein [Rhizobium sp. FY34]